MHTDVPANPLDATRPAIELDLEVATRIEGFRWVTWLEGQGPDPPRESEGRFLARHDDPLAHLQVAAPRRTPLAPQPYRHLPRYSGDAGLALRACERVGLFEEGGAELRRQRDRTWTLELTQDGSLLRDASLPTLLCRAALAWRGIRRAGRQGMP